MTKGFLLAIAAVLTTGCQGLLASPTPEHNSNLQNPAIGVHYPHTASVHCGLQLVYIDGAIWIPAEVPTGALVVGADVKVTDGNSVWDHGSIVLRDPDTAIYTSSGGTEVPLRPWHEGIDAEPGGCI